MGTIPPRRDVASEACVVLAAFGAACVAVYASNAEWREAAVLAAFALPAALVLGLIGPRTRGAARGVVKGLVALGLMYAAYVVLVPDNTAREPAHRAQTVNSLKQVALALQNYFSSYGSYPPAVVRDAGGRPLYSWRVPLLEYLEQVDLYREFHLDEPWDSPHNRGLLERCPTVYRSLQPRSDPTHAFVQAIVGPGSAFEPVDGKPEFPDPTDATLLVVEGRATVPWSAPLDVAYTPGSPIALGGTAFPRVRPLFRSLPPPEGFMAAFRDGSVRFVRLPIPEATLRALITRDGGEAVDLP